MKKRIIVIAVIVAVILLICCRYSVVERDDPLPDEVRLGFFSLFGTAYAEEAPADAPASAEPTPPAAPAPTPVPTPEPRLERGDRGDEVKALQNRLRDLGFLTGSADGVYGAKTEQAVSDFRSHLYDLTEERHAAVRAEAERRAADELAALRPEQESAADAAPAGDFPSIAPVIASEPAKTPVFDGYVDEEGYRLLLEDGFDEYQGQLSVASRGAEVKRLQTRLKALDYLKGGADGIYGQQTVRAVTAFQKRHSLTQDGIAGEKTQRLLYSASAKKQAKPVKPYLLKVSTEKQRVYAYAWSEEDAAYTKLVRTMVCSTGLADTPTPKGTFTSTTAPVVRWGYFPKYDVWAQYLYRIQGPYLFHSVLYDEADESTVRWGSVNKLGSPASHGCIRLDVPDAKWIYNNCPAGTTVQVY